MSRINSKQAKELMEAYASVHNVQEQRLDKSKYDLNKLQGGLSRDEYNNLSNSERNQLNRALRIQSLQNKGKEVGLKKGEGPVTVSSVNDEGKPQRTVEKSADGKGITITKKDLDSETDDLISNTPTIKGKSDSNTGPQRVVKSNNNNNQNTQQRSVGPTQQAASNIDKIASSGSGSGSVKVDGKKLMNTLRNQSGDNVQGGTAQQQQRPAAQQQQQQRPVAQQQQQQKSTATTTTAARPGALGRLGSLAGKAVSAGRAAAGKLKQVATSAAKGVQSAASGVKRVAGGVADAATGNLTDFDKRGGKPTGMARVVAGGIDKVTGDRTDLDKRGVTPLNAGQRAQQQQKQAPQKQAPQAQTKPVTQQQRPVSRLSGLSSGAQQAQQMAKERIAQGRNTVTGKLKSEKPKPKVTSVMDMEGYDPMENLFDDTVQFLVSEGHAKDASEAISIMSESEFINAFKEELNG